MYANYGVACKEPRSLGILMFVCLQNDAKQCCEVTKLNCTIKRYKKCFRSKIVLIVLVFGVTELLGYKQTSKSHETLRCVKGRFKFGLASFVECLGLLGMLA